jgi:hypothetical protein
MRHFNRSGLSTQLKRGIEAVSRVKSQGSSAFSHQRPISVEKRSMQLRWGKEE